MDPRSMPPGGPLQSPAALPTGISATTLLEIFIPQCGPICRQFLLDRFGFDVTIIIYFGAVLWVGLRIYRSGKTIIGDFKDKYYTAEITVDNTDEIYTQLLKYFAEISNTNSRKLKANTPWRQDDQETETSEASRDADKNPKWLDFSSKWMKPPQFTPAIGSHTFSHKGTNFSLQRREVLMFDGVGGMEVQNKEVLKLSCPGRSTEPIKSLLEYCRNYYHLRNNGMTVIMGRIPDTRQPAWITMAKRPRRSMETIVLDGTEKWDTIKDINKFLNRTREKWYADKGIPYRRGYLFHGPPGTGKTSFAFALAGFFGLTIHVISLLEPTLTEEELAALFAVLPKRCIILLEDIDATGLVRKTSSGIIKSQKGTSTEGRNFQTHISLSGLLNVIDGVASHEGHILFMTTNHPENLDGALTRPGRIDHQVAFAHATETQIQELVQRIYANDLPNSNTSMGYNGTELETIAIELGKKIPNGHFSPAEIQGFLLEYDDPKMALAKIDNLIKKGRVEKKFD